jgi:hypothetical protein
MRGYVGRVADERVAVADYDPGWPGRFTQQKALVERLLRPWLATGPNGRPTRFAARNGRRNAERNGTGVAGPGRPYRRA